MSVGFKHGQHLTKINKSGLCFQPKVYTQEVMYCKQGTEMRQIVCMSADVYCQITNNHFYATPTFLYSNGKKGKRASCWRDRERVCAKDGAWLKTELASIIKMAVGRRISYFDISGNSNVRIMFS